jgi:uncharacterized protein (TIGR03435 family)
MRRTGTFRAAMLSAILWPAAIAYCQSGSVKPGNPESAGSTYTPHMTFDVVSIRESHEGNWSYNDDPPKTSYFHAERVDAFGLILNAYNVDMMSRVKNAPDWTMATKYDVTAKSDAPTEEAIAKLSDRDAEAEKDHMLQGLLADRFKLQIHSELRQSTVYELVATPRTAKLMTPFHGDSAKTISSCALVPSKAGIEVDSKGCSYSMLLEYLKQALDADVVDHTGLSGMYVFHLMFGWQRPREGIDSYPPVQYAIPEQLGLELRKTQGPATFWVIDHIERPTPN